MAYYDLEDLKGVEDLKELGGTATSAFSAFNGLRIRASDDGEKIFYQEINTNGLGEIGESEIEYLIGTEEVLDILNSDEEHFENHYGGTAPGFYIEETLYLIDEFMRDDY